ncbi:MAG: hypothetical protein ACR2J7_10235, partial [Luteimonas sp.]
MTWDAMQQEVLVALGHTVYRRAAPERPRLADDALLHALLRAAGRRPEDDDALVLSRAWLPVRGLRGDPEAKRALWPKLGRLDADAG